METYLVIDQGNTRTKAAVFRKGKLWSTDITKRLTVKVCRAWRSKYSPDAILLSSVGTLSQAVLKELTGHPKFVLLDHSTLLPIRNRYKSPETLGVDRIACAVGAKARHPGRNVLAIDAGTCIKYDFVDSKGNYLGGSISPGIAMRFKALATFTARLPLVADRQLDDFTGKDTRTSILTGVLQGAANEVEGFISLYRKKYGKLSIVLTGGDASRLSKLLKLSIFAAPDLVLEGLYEILKHECQSR